MDYRYQVSIIRTDLISEINLVRKELRNYPDGEIMMAIDHGYLQKYHITTAPDGTRHRRGINREPRTVHRLARKAYLQERLRRLGHILDVVTKADKEIDQMDLKSIIRSLPKHFDALPEEYLLTEVLRRNKTGGISPSFDMSIPIETAALKLTEGSPADWGSRPYRQNSSLLEDKTVTMTNGMKVRSKSEAAIFDLYMKNKIPFHYDEVLKFDCQLKADSPGLFDAGNNVIYRSPDFIAVRKDGKIIYHEHFGRLDDPEYLRLAQEKLKVYYACGIVPWDNLIITYDLPGGGIDLKHVKAELAAKGLIG